MPYRRNIQYVFRAIRSVMKQSYQNFELLIIYDDVDNKDYIKLKNFLKENIAYKKIKIFKNKNNLGAGPSRNIGIDKSRGDYICFLDSDDFWHHKKLELQLQIMKKKKLIFSHTTYSILNKSFKKIGIRMAKTIHAFDDMLKSCDIGLSTVVIKKSFLINNNLRFPSIKTKEDYVLWLKISKKKIKLYGINKNLTFYQKHSNSISSNIITNIVNGFLVYKLYLNYSYIKSFFLLTRLSLNYVKKKLHDFNIN